MHPARKSAKAALPGAAFFMLAGGRSGWTRRRSVGRLVWQQANQNFVLAPLPESPTGQ